MAANFLRKEQYRKKLVLAEKPSVAMSLSKVIGANQRGDGYMEGNGYLVSWCVGIWWNFPSRKPMMKSMPSGGMMIFRFCRNIGTLRHLIFRWRVWHNLTKSEQLNTILIQALSNK